MADKVLPPEFLLAAACCRWPLSESAFAVIRAAAAGSIDWPHFLRIVTRQRIAGLAANALWAAGVQLSSSVVSALGTEAQRIARRNLMLAGETARLQREFDAAGIPVLILKGASLAEIAYGSLALKHSRDIDLMVPPEHAEVAMRLLEGQGYTLLKPASPMSEPQRRAFIAHGREAEFSHRAGDGYVELHWRLSDNPFLLQGVDAFLFTQEVSLQGGNSLCTLADSDLFAYLCVHGATHAWSRLKWLADLNALIAARDAAEIVQLYRHAQGRGAGYSAGQALVLCQSLLGLRLPDLLEAELKNNRRVQRLAAVALQAMVGVDGATESDHGAKNLTRHALMQFLLGQGFAFYAAQFRLICIGHADVIRFPLPPALYFLYPILRFPSWIWRHLR